MFKKDITYKDIDGVEVTETYHFHLTKADLIEEQIYGLGADERILEIIASGDNKTIMNHFKEIIRKSIGRREGNRFVKHPSIAEDFFASEAYSEFLFDLMTRPEGAAEFIRGIMPEDLKDKIDEVAVAQKAAQAGVPQQVVERMKGISSSKLVVDELVLGPQSVFPGAGILSVTDQGALPEENEKQPGPAEEPVFAEQPSETEGWIMKSIQQLTPDDLMKMPRDQFIGVFGSNPRAWSKQIHVAAMRRGDIHGK